MQRSDVKILVADDEEVIRRLFETALNDMGYACSFAEHGRACMERFERGEQFDILFCDLVMPKVEGHEVIRHVVKNHPDTRVIVCSVQDDDAAISELLHSGAIAYLVKPFRIENIQEVMRKLEEELSIN